MEEAAKPQKTIVQGIDAANGRMGDTKKRNSKTSVGRKNHVDIWVGVYGRTNPLGRTVRTKLAMIILIGYTLCVYRILSLAEIPGRI